MERLNNAQTVEPRRGEPRRETYEGVETTGDVLELVEDAIGFAADRQPTAQDLLLAMSSEYGILPGGVFYRREPVSTPTDFAVVLQGGRRKVTLEIHPTQHSASVIKQISR